MNSITKHNLAIFFSIALFWAVLRGNSFAQNSNTFMRMATAPGMNGGLSLAVTSDGGFVGTGQQEAGSAGNCDVYVYKVDACGTLQWERLFGNAGADGGKYVQQTSDGGYIVAGLYNSSYIILLLKIDALGNLQWSKTFEGGYGLYVQQTKDGGYILTGFSNAGGFGGNDIVLIKTDASGNLIWKKIYGGAGDDWGDYVEQTKDGGYIIAGYTSSYGAGSTDLVLLKVDSLGTMQWNKTYGGTAGEGNSSWGISGQITSDGGYMICGNTASYGAGSNDVLLVKTDSTGTLQWAKTYGGTNDDQPRFAHQTRSGGFIICGFTRSFWVTGPGDLDAYLIKTDGGGNLLWSKAYGGPAYDKCEMVRETSDGGYALSIITANFGADYYDPIFMKTDSMGVVGCHDSTCATIVTNVSPSVGTGLQEMVPTLVESSPSLTTNNYSATDIFICRHCTTVPAFVPSDTTICVGQSMFFYNTTTVGIRCFENWYVNGTVVNGNKDTLPFTFNTAGIHKIQLIASCGNTTDTSTVNIHVYDYPVAAFTNTNVCKGIVTQFHDGSTIASGSISLRTWNFGDGTTLNNSINPAHLYTNAGNYNVRLIVSNSNGCADTITKSVPVYYNPTAGFTHLDVCFRDSMHFVNTSTIDPAAAISSYSWKFGDGSALSSLKNPAHDYAAAGKDTVTLITTSADGCADTSSAAVNSFDPPQSVFIFNAICLYDSAHFVNNSVSPVMGTTASWSWNFGDGSPLNTAVLSPHHIYANPGSYLVTLTVHSSNLGCPDTLQAAIIVPPTPVADFSFTNVCSTHALHFHDLSTVSAGSIVLHSWDFGDGSPADTSSSPTHTYTSPGTYSVRLIVTTDRGCKDTIIKNTVVHPLPVVYFNTSDVCDQNSVHFNDFSDILPTDTIHSWHWNFGDGTVPVITTNTSHLYALPGSYTVQLIDVSNFGCSDSINKTIIVHPNPVAGFKNTNVCQGLATMFTDTSTTALGSITAWGWNYGDASPLGTIQNPSRLYASGGMYNVTLIAGNNFGCADTITKPVRVFYNPVANFSHIDVCLGDSLHFTNASTITLPDSLAAYLWVFGDNGPTGSTASPAHYYSLSGTYNATLLSRTTKGCSNAMTHSVKTYDAPQSAFSKNNICLFDSVLFTNTTIPPVMGSTASWCWNYGDNSGLNTTVWSPFHHYLLPGHYQVALITRSSNLGCADTLKDSITVYPMPVAGYSFRNVCLNQPMLFNDSSRISSGSIAVHTWNFGDGTSPNGNPNPSHLYANPGTRPVTLIVTSGYGCKDTIVKNTVVHPLPHARIYALDVCNGAAVQFADSSYIAPSDTIHSWRWNYADNSALSTTQNTSHLYASAGVYPVQLFITSNFGCLDSVIRTITVNPNPVVSFTRNDSIGCEPLCVTFQNTSTVNPGTNTAFVWNYGDQSPAGSGQSPFHCYHNDSVFAPNLLDVTLTVSSDSGCVSTKTKNHYITVYPMPIAGFTALPSSASIVNPVITITDKSIGGNYWHWNFGDQDTTSIHYPNPHTYADTGAYLIRQIVSTQYNCIDTSYQTVFIEPDFVFYVPNSFSPNDDGINDIFIGKGIFISEYEMMIFDRWGNLIFYSNDSTKGWDGTANHGTESAQRDVYIYSIKITDFNQRKHSYKGTVTLVK